MPKKPVAARIFEKTAKKHQDHEEPNLHQAHAAIKGKHRRNYPVCGRFATRQRTQDCEQKEQPARPSEYGGSQNLNTSILSKETAQYFIHHRNSKDYAEGVSGPVRVKVALGGEISVNDKQTCRFEGLKQNVGKDRGNTLWDLRRDHEDQQGDLQQRTSKPVHIR